MLDQETTESSILAAFAQWTDAWNNGDVSGYLAAYRQSDHTCYISNGTLIKGYDAITAHFQHRIQQNPEMGTLTTHNIEVTVINSEYALLIGAFELSTPTGQSHGIFTLYVRKVEGRWYIITDHTSG